MFFYKVVQYFKSVMDALYHRISIFDECVVIIVDNKNFLWNLSTMQATRLHPSN